MSEHISADIYITQGGKVYGVSGRWQLVFTRIGA